MDGKASKGDIFTEKVMDGRASKGDWHIYRKVTDGKVSKCDLFTERGWGGIGCPLTFICSSDPTHNSTSSYCLGRSIHSLWYHSFVYLMTFCMTGGLVSPPQSCTNSPSVPLTSLTALNWPLFCFPLPSNPDTFLGMRSNNKKSVFQPRSKMAVQSIASFVPCQCQGAALWNPLYYHHQIHQICWRMWWKSILCWIHGQTIRMVRLWWALKSQCCWWRKSKGRCQCRMMREGMCQRKRRREGISWCRRRRKGTCQRERRKCY